MKKLIVFDLDGTLAESKASLDAYGIRKLRDTLGIAIDEMIEQSNGSRRCFESGCVAWSGWSALPVFTDRRTGQLLAPR